MASDWLVSLTLIDGIALKTTLNFRYHSDEIIVTDGFNAANQAADALVTDLEAVTDANVYSQRITYLKDLDESLPAGDNRVTNVAQVVCYLTPDGVAPKFHVLRIPAPNVGIFGADEKTIDKTDAALIDYVANFLDGEFQVSDGEHIDDTIDDGIKGGSWTSVKKNTKAVQGS